MKGLLIAVEIEVVCLQIVFLLLRLLGAIHWSWWLVFLPAIVYGEGTLLLWALSIIAERSVVRHAFDLRKVL